MTTGKREKIYRSGAGMARKERRAGAARGVSDMEREDSEGGEENMVGQSLETRPKNPRDD